MLTYFGLAIGIITLAIALGKIIFDAGRSSARLDSLEEWRTNVRSDMHEISDKITNVETGITAIKTMLDERTERRTVARI
jgi:hypothetical protein